jgi:hypothetical protein
MPDDQTIVEGDAGFLGMASRLNPLQLQAGMVQYCENMRLDRGVAQTRKGAKRVAENINPSTDVLLLNFTLGTNRSIATLTQVGGLATASFSAPHNLSNLSWVNISGASGSEYNGDFQISVTSPTDFTYSVVSGAPGLAGGSPIANNGPVVKTTYGGDIIQSGIYSSPRFDNAREYIVLAAPSEAYLWRHDAATVESVAYPLGDTMENGDDVEIVQAFDKLYLLRTRPSDISHRVQSISNTSGTALVTMNAAHGYKTGEVVRISDSETLGFNGDWVVTKVSDTEFSYTLPVSVTDPAAAGRIFARRVLPALVWDGDLDNNFERVEQGAHPLGVTYSRLPSTSIATYHNNQLVIARNRDEVLVSDVFDAETYDAVAKAFRANAGSNDYIVGLHPFSESQILVFCRKSIWLATAVIGADGVSIDPSASSLQLLTNEIGCSAKRTITTAGTAVLFLSDRGVYRLDSQFDLKLRGNTMPLSDPISDLVATINNNSVETSNAVYFDNRYFLAVPTGESAIPNAVFVFNMLNAQWETKDVFPFGVDRLLVSDYGTQRRLFASSRYGSLYLIDENEDGNDDGAFGSSQTPVAASLLTRRYGWGNLNAKRLLRVKASTVLPAGSACSLDAVTTDYDNDFEIAALSNAAGSQEDYTLKTPLRCKATALDLRYRTTAGRPILRQITAEAALTGPASSETRTLN